MLKAGSSIPETEKRLVHRGLSPEEASALVDGVLDEAFRKQSEERLRANRRKWVHRVLSALLACAVIVIAYRLPGRMASQISSGVLVSLACVWFSEELWSYTDAQVRARTPSNLLRVGGWLVLLGIGIFTLTLL
jgi:hypothetical protein